VEKHGKAEHGNCDAEEFISPPRSDFHKKALGLLLAVAAAHGTIATSFQGHYVN